MTEELSLQLQRVLKGERYTTVSFLPKTDPVEWKFVEQPALQRREARSKVEIKEAILRTKNDLDLNENRSGRAIVVKVEIGL